MAAQDILAFYPQIPANDPRRFAAGLVELLSTYPQAVVRRARASSGIPANLEFLNLAAVKKLLDGWADEHWQDVQRSRKQIAPPVEVEDPEAKARVNQVLFELKQAMRLPGFGIPKNEQAQIEEMKRKNLKPVLPPAERPQGGYFVPPTIDASKLKLSPYALREARGSIPWSSDDLESQIDNGFSPSTV